MEVEIKTTKTTNAPEKCRWCDMPDRFRPIVPGCCGVCITNKKAKELKESKDNGNN